VELALVHHPAGLEADALGRKFSGFVRVVAVESDTLVPGTIVSTPAS